VTIMQPTARNIFICYAAADDARAALIECIAAALRVYGCAATYDLRDFAARSGIDWRESRNRCIGDCNIVLLVATSDIFEADASGAPTDVLREQVREELNIARAMGKDIQVLQVGNRKLIDKIVRLEICPWVNGKLDPNPQVHTMSVPASLPISLGDTDQAALFSIAIGEIDGYFESLGAEAGTWANAVLGGLTTLLLEASSQPMLQCSQFLTALKDTGQERDMAIRTIAVIAQGGQGKSVLLARIILEALKRGIWPLIVPAQVLSSGRVDLLAKWLGAPNSATIDETLRQHWFAQRRLLFVIDGLEQYLSDRDSVAAPNVLPCLKRLSANAAVIIACRSEAWDVSFSAVLAHAEQISIAGEARKALLAKQPELEALALKAPFLFSDALAIDYCLSIKYDELRLPDSRRALLTGMLERDAGISPLLHPNATTASPPIERTDALRALARTQLAHGSFAVPKNDFGAMCNRMSPVGVPGVHRPSGQEVLAGVLAHRADGKLRLRHDILDAANCASTLLERGAAGVRAWMSEIGSSEHMDIVIAMFWLAENEPDASGEVTQLELFNNLLRLLDLKTLKESNPASMWRAWLVTWILERLLQDGDTRRIYEFALKMMTGRRLQDYPANGKPRIDEPNFRYSSAGAEPGWTVPALSTVASVWKVYESGQAPDPERTVPILQSLLTRTRFRARVIEALGKYTTPQAIDTLVNVCRAEAAQDPDLLDSIVRALLPLAKDNFAVMEVLKLVVTSPAAPPAAVRLADTASVPAQRRKDTELLLALRTEGRAKGESSDWSKVYDAACHIKKHAEPAQFGPEVRAALAQCMYHDHARAAASAADAMSRFADVSSIRALMLRLITRSEQLDSLQLTAIETSLREIAREIGDEGRGLLRALRVCRVIAEGRGLARPVDLLVRLLAPEGLAEDGFSLNGASASLLSEVENESDSVTWMIIEGDESPLDTSVLSLVDETTRAAAGPNIETKFRVVLRDGRRELARTTWKCGRAHHLALRKVFEAPDGTGLDVAGYMLDCALTPAKFVSVSPGIAVAHVLCLTSDRQLLCAQRPMNAQYAPGAWSISYEEQLGPADMRPGMDPFFAAALRGFHEEFGIGFEADDVKCFRKDLFLEHPIMNTGVVICLELPRSAAEIMAAWSGTPPPSHKHEAVALRFLTANAVDDLVNTELDSSLHPTSGLRIAAFRESTTYQRGGA
jgi:hypothetical protein